MAAAMLSAVGCQDEMYNNEPREAHKLSVADSIVVDMRAQNISLGVTARDTNWTMAGAEDWCTVDPASGDKGTTQITVAFTANESEDEENPAVDRTAEFVFTSGDSVKRLKVIQLNSDIPLPNEHPDKYINSGIYEHLEQWYYNGEPATVTPDFNQSYDDFYFNYLARSLRRNEDFEGNTWATNGDYYEERYIYSYIEKNPLGTADQADPTPPLNYGMEFDINRYDGKLVGRILYVEPGSPAFRAGLKRGDWFNKVNGTTLGDWQTNVGDFGWHYNRFLDTLVNPVEGFSPRLGMLSFRSASRSLLDEGKTVTITPEHHHNYPFLGEQIFTVPRLETVGGERTARVGYLMYNNFEPRYRDDLIEKFATFKAGLGGEPLDSFILDLRYNKHGSVDMAELMGNLLVGGIEEVTGTPFAKYRFATGTTPPRTEVNFEKHDNSIAPRTIYILTSRYTAGAAELLINALRGIDQEVVKLVMIGDDTTQGLAAGMVECTYRDPEDTEWEYSARMLAFRCFNANDEGDYTWGLVPNGGTVDEWGAGENIKWSATWEWKGQDGSTEDPLIRHAVDYIKGRLPIPPGGVINGSEHTRRGFPREFCFPTNMMMDIDD